MKKSLFLVMALAVIATTVFAQTEADFQVELTDDGAGVVIVKYTGKTAQVRIPATIQGMPVMRIGKDVPDWDAPSGVFEYTPATSVVIPAGVTTIGNRAFINAQRLTSVTIPEGVTEIEAYAFSNRAITTLQLPKSLKTIGESAFRDSSITSVAIPVGVTEIPPDCFNECKRLQTVTLPEGLTVIDRGAFGQCTALTALTLPASIKDIRSGAFFFCSALTTVTIPDSVATISITDRYDGSFEGCSKLNLASQSALKRRGYTGSF